MALRILHCPTNTGNNPQVLARAERRLGLDSWCIELHGSSFAYEVDEVLAPPGSSRVTIERRRWQLLRRALRDYDVVHFNFGSTILPAIAPPLPDTPTARQRLGHGAARLYSGLLGTRDLPLLKWAGKKIVVTYQGDDARQGTGPLADDFHRELAARAGPGYYTDTGDAVKRSMIAAFDRYADRIYYLNPDLGRFLPERARFMPYASVDPAEWQPVGASSAGVPTVLHAPSHQGIKGTRHILDAAERLRREGVPFELRLVEGVTHEEARRMYEQADVLVDQLLVGWYGGVAVELMALAKPVVCFIDPDATSRYAPPALMRDLPVIRATRDDLADVLRALLTDRRDELPALGRRSRMYAETWHDPHRIAAGLRDDYEAIAGGKA